MVDEQQAYELALDTAKQAAPWLAGTIGEMAEEYVSWIFAGEARPKSTVSVQFLCLIKAAVDMGFMLLMPDKPSPDILERYEAMFQYLPR